MQATRLFIIVPMEGTQYFLYFSHDFVHHDNMPVKCIPPYTPPLCNKTGVCRGLPMFLIFVPKHRLWVRTIYVLSKDKNNIKTFLLIFFFFQFLQLKKNLYIT